MPTFPTYDGELPQCLNPLNPRHYGLVLYWVFFRPTALKCYLYQASPKIYKSEGGWENFVAGIRHKSYCDLSLISIVSPFFFSLIFISGIFLFVCHFNIDLIFGRLHDFLYLLKAGTQLVAIGVTLGVVTSIAFGIAFGVAFGIAFGVATNISLGIVISLIGSVVVLTLPFNTSFSFSILPIIIFGLAFVLAGGMTFDIAFVVAFGVALGMLGSTADVAGGVAIGVGAIRLPFYFIESISLLIPKRVLNSHSIIWDELGVLPLPKATQYLASELHRNPTQGLSYLAQTIGNPFQALTVQHAGWMHLEVSAAPIETLYYWATAKELDRYAQAPILPYQWKYNISSRQLIFAKLVDSSLSNNGEFLTGLYRNLLKLFSNHLRRQPIPVLQELIFFFFLFHSLSEIIEINELLRQIKYDSIINLDPQLENYTYGTEVRQSISNIFTYLQFTTPEEIATAPTHLTWLNPTDTFLRPTVIQALSTLANLSQEVQRSNIVSSAVNKRNAILIANDQLEQLKTYVTDQIHPNYPEQKLLLRIIDQWQTIITREGGQLGGETLEKPIENPYVVGPPVTGSLFVGREDILTILEELWTKPGQLESVVIYGHRRMGKTSILRNLPGRFSNNTKIINFNIQTQGNVRSTTELIFNLAQAIHDDLPPHLQTANPEPQITDFDRPEQSFKRFLKKLEPHRQNDRFIIAIDEFELIEDGIKNGYFEPSLIGHWRGILTDFHWIIFAFAGLHTLQEMTQNYWNPLFGNVRKIPVSFLTPTAARRLITQPSPDFAIDYNPEAIELIYTLTGGQPYLIQLICQNLVSNFNRQRFEENREIEPLFTEAEVTAIVTNPDFFRDGTAYFHAIWEQAQETHAETQLAILKQLALSPATETELNNLIKPSFMPEALNLLLTHDVIQLNSENQYNYRVELMRQWVQLRD